MRNFDAHTQQSRQEMMKDLNVGTVEELYSHISQDIRAKELNLSQPLNEFQLQEEIKKLAKKNNTDYAVFIGAGAYKHFIPASVSSISSRFEFNTAYTPYQPEISQGTLQAVYEYQSMICNLTGMDVSNASIYDAATSCAEALLMAVRITGRNKCAVAASINPQYLEVIKTYCEAADIEVTIIDFVTDTYTANEEYACILVQTPDFYGEITDIEQITRTDSKTLLICCVDIFSLGLLEPPNCDIIVGDIQSLGNSLSYGGPYGGFLACKDKYKRQIPGRVVGRTLDAEEKQAFTLTLQTREQHIRREKATSNICSNQALIALQATVYLTVTGKEGFKEVAYLCAKNAHELANLLKSKGVKVLNKEFFNEFTIEVDSADDVLAKLKAKNILGGIKLSENKLIVCATEINTQEQMEEYASVF